MNALIRVSLASLAVVQAAFAQNPMVRIANPDSRAVAGAPTVDISINPNNRFVRSSCVTSGAGPAGAFQCADLLVTHASPSYKTLDRDHSLTLLYNSASAKPYSIVMADVSLSSSVTVPDRIDATLVVNSVTRASASFSATGFTSGGAKRRISLGFDPIAASLYSGAYSYTLNVTNVYGTQTYTTSVTGDLMVVERVLSPYGAGWSVAGTSRVISSQRNNSVIRIDADGSAVIYENIGGSVWQAPSGAYRDTLRWDFVTDAPFDWGNYWWRRDQNGTRIFYDYYGRLAYVVDRIGNKVEYHYAAIGDNEGIDYIQIAPWDLTKRYQFSYTSSKLSAVTDPGGRRLTASVNGSNQLVSLRDSGDVNAILYSYDSSQRMTQWRSHLGKNTSYRYYTNALFGATGMLASDSLPIATTANTSTFIPVQLLGLATASSGNVTPSSDTVRITIDGPRTDVSDIARFTVNGDQAPLKITDPLGNETTIQYASNVPLLVSRADFPNGRSVRLRYDNTARLEWVEDDTPAGVRDSTTYLYLGAVPDQPSQINTPLDGTTRLATSFTYNSNGTLQQTTDPTGHVTSFTYNSRAQVDTVIEQSVTVFESSSQQRVTRNVKTRFHRDALANTDSVISDKDRKVGMRRDSYGNMIKSGTSAGDSVTYTYNARNFQTAMTQYDGATTFTTQTAYDDDGNLTSHTDPRSVGRSWTYDAIGRQIVTTDEFSKSDSIYYDPAGNVTATRARSGATTSSTYDALNRVLQRILNPVVTDTTVPGDTSTFLYGVAGSALPTRAANRNNVLRRTYSLDGSVLTEIDSLKFVSVVNAKSYSYNHAGSRLTLLTPQSRTIGYSYDNSGLLAWISAGPGNAYTRWFTLGGRDSLYLPDGSGTKYYYDGDALLKRIYTYHPNITPYQGKGIVDTYLYYNGAGRPDSMIDYSVYAQGASGDKTIFLYDGRGQLKNKSGPQTSDAYYYDGSGNRTAARFAGDSITYFTPSGTNRLQTSSAPLGTTTYFYNDNGAVVKDSTRQFYSAVSPSAFFRRIRKSYFDAAGRLTISKLDSLVYNSSGTLISTYSPAPLQYRYDAMGRQFIREPGTGGTILAVLDGNAMLGIGNMEIVDVGLDEPLMLLAPTGSAVCGVSTMYFVTNVNRLFDYHRPDGTTCIQSGNDGWETYGRQAGAIGDSYNFSLKNANGQSGLSFFRNRFYNPTSGRFTQEDPLGFAGGLNLYGYAGNNPATYTDPFGLCPPIEDCLRQAGSLVAGFLPGVSTVQDATTLVSGKDVLTGARVGAAGRLIAGIGLLTPFSGGEIAGGGKAVSVTKHYLDRKLERGVLSSEVWDALKNPLKVKGVKIDELGRPSQQIIGRGATVVQNPETGALINTWHTSSGLVKKLEQ